MRDIHISITSHGHCKLMADLLSDLSSVESVARLQVTLIFNIPEECSEIRDQVNNYPFPIIIINNPEPLGFGDNQNLAFSKPVDDVQRKYFVTINPDVRIKSNVLARLIKFIDNNDNVGIIAPISTNYDNTVQDSARVFPTLTAILRKLLFGDTGRTIFETKPVRSDWVSGMFMVFPKKVYTELDGFDTRFRLYYEDVDLCARVWIAGYEVWLDPTQQVIHCGNKQSHRNLKLFLWHLSSMARYFLSNVRRRAIKSRSECDSRTVVS